MEGLAADCCSFEAASLRSVMGVPLLLGESSVMERKDFAFATIRCASRVEGTSGGD